MKFEFDFFATFFFSFLIFLKHMRNLAMKIHVSENTKLLLDHVGGFQLKKRGNVEIKVRKQV